MHLAVLGGIGHFYAMQVSLTRSLATKNATANLSARFHQDIKFWRSLCVKIKTRPTYLANIFHWAVSIIVYIDAPGQGAGGVWIDPNEYGINFYWKVKWPDDIVRQLVSFTNPGDTITNWNL